MLSAVEENHLTNNILIYLNKITAMWLCNSLWRYWTNIQLPMILNIFLLISVTSITYHLLLKQGKEVTKIKIRKRTAHTKMKYLITTMNNQKTLYTPLLNLQKKWGTHQEKNMNLAYQTTDLESHCLCMQCQIRTEVVIKWPIVEMCMRRGINKTLALRRIM